MSAKTAARLQVVAFLTSNKIHKIEINVKGSAGYVKVSKKAAIAALTTGATDGCSVWYFAPDRLTIKRTTFVGV